MAIEFYSNDPLRITYNLTDGSRTHISSLETKTLIHDLLALCDLLLDNFYNTWLRDSAEIAELITFTGNDFTHNAAHNLRIRYIELMRV